MLKLNLKQKLALCAVIAAGATAPVLASHSWGGYHWVRTAAEINVPVGDNVDSRWDSYLSRAVTDWNTSTVINSSLGAGSANPKNCRGVAGTIQVCNSTYGNTGWLGIASISISGGHISQGTTKLNDTYFNTAQYNTPAWRAMVTCQEVGHDYGLAHQDENFSNYNLGTCMDYTNAPDGGVVGGFNYGPGNRYPNAHDYDELNTIYNHLESGMTIGGSGRGNSGADIGDTPATWGRAIHFTADGRPDLFERIDGPGQKTLTHVLWALGEGPRGR
ncbi:MAG: hypothetical protein H7312_01845 [Tardiphaga sp.]|nr:hypothetical protein [Tardiphaga sp.]